MAEAGVSHDWDRAYLLDRVQSAADWFYWLAAFTMGNAIWSVFAVDRAFVFAPGIALLPYAFVEPGGPGRFALSLGLGTGFTILLTAFGWFARRSIPVFVVGFGLYVLDAALVAVAGLWLHLAVHGYVLYKLGNGISAVQKLRKLPPEVDALP